MTDRLRIVGGRVYDPRHGIDGQVRDVCIEAGRIVPSVPPDAPTLDARGRVVMPGGVDIHCHIAGPKVNTARRLDPQARRADPVARRRSPENGAGLRSGTGGLTPSTFVTGYRYAGLGYTSAFEAAIPALGARQAHHELNDTPVIDKGFYLLCGNDELLLRLLERGEETLATHYLSWLLAATRAYALKLVNPGGVTAWKEGRLSPGLDDALPGRDLTPRRVLRAVAAAADALALPHPVHLHCNHLGVPGNATTTLESMRAVDGHRAHFAHLQFHAYGGEPDGAPSSRAAELVAYLNEHAELSADVGQVMFGEAVAMTGDTRVAHLLHRLTGRKWVDQDLELESGCGIVPYEYRERNLVHALQWAIGLELLLLSTDPWRVVLSTDHPNGGSFLAYPRVIRLLMDRTFRDEQIRRLPPAALAGTALADGLEREYTLYEIAIVTRAGPARLLGLEHKGHLGSGADADITIYDPDTDAETMFATPHWVLKGGQVVVEEGELRHEPYGATHHVAPAFDLGVEPMVRRFLRDHGTLGPDELRIDADELARAEEVRPAAMLP